jgi:V8-like Glu-specific endopeptidase
MRPGDKWGFIPLRTKQIANEQLCNIIQHPKGRRKEVALHDNRITEIYKNVIRYRTDTEPGSSGSPVFDNEWDLIALHHSAGKQEDNIWLSNEGVRMDIIISDLKKYLKDTQNGSSVAQDLGLDLS